MTQCFSFFFLFSSLFLFIGRICLSFFALSLVPPCVLSLSLFISWFFLLHPGVSLSVRFFLYTLDYSLIVILSVGIFGFFFHCGTSMGFFFKENKKHTRMTHTHTYARVQKCLLNDIEKKSSLSFHCCWFSFLSFSSSITTSNVKQQSNKFRIRQSQLILLCYSSTYSSFSFS